MTFPFNHALINNKKETVKSAFCLKIINAKRWKKKTNFPQIDVSPRSEAFGL